MLQVKSLEEMTISEDDPSSNAFAELDKAIKAQQTALGVTVNLAANLDDVVDANRTSQDNLASLKSHLTQMKQKQDIVGSHMTRAWKVSIEPKPGFVARLVELRDNEHKRILGKITETGQSKEIDNSSASYALKSVEKQQVFLLDQLIALKGIVAKQSQIDAEKVMAELLGETDESLSPTPEETLDNTVKELDGFIKQQKDIMQKRQMVLDQPPEDFSEEDEQLLEDLAIDQSKLAEILSSLVNDLSNMNLLDFGDSQMVESMKSVYEKAEELMINCEATLGFYDNIQFVAEIPKDEQLMAPLAELPSELEDLVGDLITSEAISILWITLPDLFPMEPSAARAPRAKRATRGRRKMCLKAAAVPAAAACPMASLSNRLPRTCSRTSTPCASEYPIRRWKPDRSRTRTSEPPREGPASAKPPAAESR